VEGVRAPVLRKIITKLRRDDVRVGRVLIGEKVVRESQWIHLADREYRLLASEAEGLELAKVFEFSPPKGCRLFDVLIDPRHIWEFFQLRTGSSGRNLP
jgi:hypothetical protein